MEVNFGTDGSDATPATDIADATPSTAQLAPAPVAAPAPGPQAVAPTSKLLLGDTLPDFKDIIMPRLHMAQNIGGLQETYDPGTIIFNQAVPLFIPGRVNPKTQQVERTPTAPVIMIALGFKPTRFCEKVKWGAEGGANGLVVNSEEEVRAVGGTLDFNEWKAKEKYGMKRFEPLADGLFAVQRPEGNDAQGNPLCPDDDSVFNFEVEGKKYLLALWGLRGTCYTAACKRVLFYARRAGCLRLQGYPAWTWKVTTREESWPGGVKSWIPIFAPHKVSTAEQVNFAKSILGA